MAEEHNVNASRLPEERIAQLFNRHLKGALVRSGASVALWLVISLVYALGFLEFRHFAGVTACVLYIILINLPALYFAKKIRRRTLYRYFSMSVNLLEVIGYTGIIYFLGGIEATWLTPLYAALIIYIGVVSPRKFSFVAAGFCSGTFALLVVLSYAGVLPEYRVVLNSRPPLAVQLLFVFVITGSLFGLAYLASYASGLLKESRNTLRWQNLELEQKAGRLEQAERDLRTAHQGLEKRVAERTRELERLNEELRRQVAERVRFQEALQKSERRYREMVDALPEIVFELNREGKIRFSNSIGFDLFGYTPDDMHRGVDGTDLLIPEDRERATNDFRTLLVGRLLGSIEYTARRKDGNTFPISVNVTPVFEDGKVAFLRGIAVDLTWRKRAIEALKMEKERFRILVEEAPFGVSLIAGDGRYRYVNPRFTEIFGYALEDVPWGRDWFKAAFPDPAYRRRVKLTWMEDLSGAEVGEAKPRIFRVTCKNGTEREIHFRTVILGTGDLLVTYEDITEKRRLEIQVQQAQKLESLGHLAGGVAHDFNNVLMGIQGNVSLVLLDRGMDDPDYQRLKNIERYAEQGAGLTKQLLGFARGGKYETKLVNVNDLVKKGIEMFARTRKEIVVHTRYQDGVWMVEADPAQVDQALLNLYMNAWQAMPEGGDLTIRTENVYLDGGYTKPFRAEPGKYVKLVVADNGVGMNEAVRQRIFEPFFTTKHGGTGTGLGLASVYGIVNRHGGMIDVSSEKGEGTTFVVYLPAADGTTFGHRAGGENPHGMPGGGETILLVDDEEMIIEIGEQILTRLGYSVLVARSGEEAVEIYDANAASIHMVILDMIMPGMGGKETYQRLKEINPGVRVLLSSGYSVKATGRDIMENGCNGFLQKPFNLKELAEKIREILEKE